MENFVDLAELFKIYVKYIFTSISLLLTNRALLEAAVSRVNVKQEFSNNYFPFQLVSQANLTLILKSPEGITEFERRILESISSS